MLTTSYLFNDSWNRRLVNMTSRGCVILIHKLNLVDQTFVQKAI